MTKHDPLIARALFFLRRRIHPLRDMRRLGVQQIGDFNRFVMKFVLLIADIFDARSHDAIDILQIVLQLCLI